ncbi:MAG: glycosyltransferase, partial [Halobacteria archaeon]|nr:glycosyltransferase [Halobacteria archaeon]
MGMAGASLAISEDIPLVANYHTPTDEYVDYMTTKDRVAQRLRAMNNWWERKFLDHADIVITPSMETKYDLITKGVNPRDIRVLRNGIDVDFFRPVDSSDFEDEYGISSDRPTVGYCGRHGYEKRLGDLVETAKHLDADTDIVIVGDGPARDDLIEYASELGAENVVFPGFLERERLPEFYSALDVFAFPS